MFDVRFADSAFRLGTGRETQLREVAAENPGDKMVDALVAREVDYSACIDRNFFNAFKLRPGQIPGGQISALLWSSYHVGMELPGQQALFSELDFQFAEKTVSGPAIHLELQSATFRARLNRILLTGKGSGIESLRIVAFRRPDPVDYPLVDLRNYVGGSRFMRGKVVFISGASRGFGVVLARFCALSGAKLALNFRQDQDGINAIVEELEAVGTEVRAYQADMSQSEQVIKLAAAIRGDPWRLQNARHDSEQCRSADSGLLLP